MDNDEPAYVVFHHDITSSTHAKFEQVLRLIGLIWMDIVALRETAAIVDARKVNKTATARTTNRFKVTLETKQPI